MERLDSFLDARYCIPPRILLPHPLIREPDKVDVARDLMSDLPEGEFKLLPWRVAYAKLRLLDEVTQTVHPPLAVDTVAGPAGVTLVCAKNFAFWPVCAFRRWMSSIAISNPKPPQNLSEAMAPQVKSWRDLSFLSECVSPDSNDTVYTTFALVDDEDRVFFGQLPFKKTEITFEQITAALEPVPDEHIYPELPKFTVAPKDINRPDVYIKRPSLSAYEDLKEEDALGSLPLELLDEARILELTLRKPHPGIVQYFGCRIHRSHITGLVLRRYEYNIYQYLQLGIGTLTSDEKEAFMKALEGAVRHLHSELKVSHNDINPLNIMVTTSDKMPVLVDFGSARKIGEKLGVSRGTPGWIDEEDDYTTSDVKHDLFALGKIREWLEDPKFEM
ncbi:kinase-like domain-containing protein [Copromyces sp. CBS 386.78]|nr:kinase-like domain-containing protein [Copromyces sp. CBS 386.78]